MDRKFSSNVEYIPGPSVLSSPFEFPLGHRDRICHFVRELRYIEKENTKSKKLLKSERHIAKKPKLIKT